MKANIETIKGSRRDPCEEYLSLAGIAGYITDRTGREVTLNTIKSYYKRGRLPAPDVVVGRNQGWAEETIRIWQNERPGRGARTDLRS